MYQLRRLVGQVAGPSYARVPQSNGNGTTSPLLPTFSSQKDEDDEPPSTPNGTTSPSRPRPIYRRLLLPILFVLGLFAAIAVIAYFMGEPSSKDVVPPPPAKVPPEDHSKSPTDHPATDTDTELATDPVAAARLSLDVLFARQSQTLAQAAARYSLKTDRAPPANFDKWFAFAKKKKCLIDDYDQIQRDLSRSTSWRRKTQTFPGDDRPWYGMLQDSKGMTTINIKNGKFISVLPDMDFMLNGRDEPRVVFNYRDPAARKDAMVLKDPNPFHIAPRPTSDFFKDRSGCNPLGTSKGFGTDGSADIACELNYPHCARFLCSCSPPLQLQLRLYNDLWPLLSMTKISPCFSDILFPGQYYYDESWWSGSFEHPNDIAWKDKKPMLYWRGMSNGGHILGQTITSSRMTRFAETHCTEDCDRNHIIAEYDINGPQSPKEDVYKYKYLLDVDGNTFSGRYLGLLKSGSLVFKSTVFDEYFDDWLLPYQHYIPVLPDLSDVVEKVQWAIAHESEARVIQETGKLFTERVMTDSQNDCYFAMVLLEWARLQSYAKHPPPNSESST
ncbi:glycosyl transferase family 90-domain-containing protein [Mycena leptocephala]|nr:glycosyl transferase family 90-domain-containing protein [Mycena leptocephala]